VKNTEEMEKKFLRALFVVLFSGILVMPSPAKGSNFIQRLQNGSIDWTNRIVEAVAYCSYPEGIEVSRARSLAKTNAIDRARNNLMSIVLNIPLDGNKLVGEILKNDPEKLRKLSFFVNKAEMATISFPQNKGVRVTLSLKLSDEVAELILPKYIKKIKPITTVASSSKRPTDSYTGILIDCRTIGFRPCLIPRVVNEKGEEVFGPAYVSRERVTDEGMVKYVAGPDERIKDLWLGKRVLNIKALRVLKENPSVVVLVNSDAELLRGDPANLSLFRDCKVVFMLD